MVIISLLPFLAATFCHAQDNLKPTEEVETLRFSRDPKKPAQTPSPKATKKKVRTLTFSRPPVAPPPATKKPEQSTELPLELPAPKVIREPSTKESTTPETFPTPEVNKPDPRTFPNPLLEEPVVPVVPKASRTTQQGIKTPPRFDPRVQPVQVGRGGPPEDLVAGLPDIELLLRKGLPGRDVLFQLQSEKSLRERIRQEGLSRATPERVEFPEDIDVIDEVYQGRFWPQSYKAVEPNYVTYRRPYFAQKNFERYGWELPVVQPLVCAGKFYWDVFFLPYNMGTEPLRKYESSAGYCLPGDPAPLRLYPPRYSLTGLATQGLALSGLFAAFP